MAGNYQRVEAGLLERVVAAELPVYGEADVAETAAVGGLPGVLLLGHQPAISSIPAMPVILRTWRFLGANVAGPVPGAGARRGLGMHEDPVTIS